ncbi:hypothetical protein DVH24_002558 [Malus domestica]|uniref:Uncharacterized protein n=1 Tax=Malus domestica TaxID=3750 RepID=A0A498IQC8_MALDO|nr:hypothetical protein DVH24_002558 [Malus domestica]
MISIKKKKKKGFSTKHEPLFVEFLTPYNRCYHAQEKDKHHLRQFEHHRRAQIQPRGATHVHGPQKPDAFIDHSMDEDLAAVPAVVVVLRLIEIQNGNAGIELKELRGSGRFMSVEVL